MAEDQVPDTTDPEDPSGQPDSVRNLDTPIVELSQLLTPSEADDAAFLRQAIQQPRARQTIERIFGAVRMSLLRASADEINVQRIVEQASITEPTFYRYFTSVDHVVQAGVRRVALRRVRAWQSVLNAQRFRNMAEAADFMAELGTRHLLAINGMPLVSLRRFIPHIDAVAAELVGPISISLREAMQRGGIVGTENIDPRYMDAILLGMMRMATSIAAADMNQLRHEKTKRQAAAILLAAFLEAAA